MRRPSLPDLPRRPLLLGGVVVAVLVVALAAAGLAALRDGGGDGARAGLPGRAAPAKPASQVRLSVTPRHRAAGVRLDAHAKVVASNGTLRSVAVRAADGRRLTGRLADNRRSWISSGPLAPATRYRVTVQAVDEAGTPARQTTSFTTLRPRAELRAAVMPLEGETVGVGLPIGVWFNQPVADRAAVERRLQVASSVPVDGAWHWFNDKEVHYRPRSYWPSGAKVTLRARLAGTAAGAGVWGVADRTVSFRIGDRHVSVVNASTHQMKVVANGR
ncbi:MAG TPA: Ig-like domain-containing protein, partial [Actinomycetes bacterium]